MAAGIDGARQRCTTAGNDRIYAWGGGGGKSAGQDRAQGREDQTGSAAAPLLALVAPASACDGHKYKSKVVKCSSYTTVTGTTKTTCRTR